MIKDLSLSLFLSFLSFSLFLFFSLSLSHHLSLSFPLFPLSSFSPPPPPSLSFSNHIFYARPWVMSPCMLRRIPRRRAVRTRLTLPGLSASHHGASGALGGGLDRTTSPTRGLIEPGASASGTGAVIGPLPTPPPDQGDSEEQPRDIVRIISGNQYGAHTRTVSLKKYTLFIIRTICMYMCIFLLIYLCLFHCTVNSL